MVKIAIAGGSGEVAREVTDGLIAANKHEILLLSRKDAPTESLAGVTWAKVTYDNVEHLAKALGGVDVVLSFITSQTDPESKAQKTLIDAAVQAGVKRFAPSEWGSSSFGYMDWYAGKAEIRKYLKELNRDQKVLEYSLFQPGMFTNYMTFPHQSSKYVKPFQTQVDFASRRALILQGGEDDLITLTTSQDLVNVVVQAIDYQGEWPVNGGVKGTDITMGQLVALGEEIRGGQFRVEKLEPDDLKNGVVNASWLPTVDHPAIPKEQAQAMAGNFLSAVLLSISTGALSVSDDWNKLLPDYKFTDAGEFLKKEWHGRQ